MAINFCLFLLAHLNCMDFIIYFIINPNSNILRFPANFFKYFRIKMLYNNAYFTVCSRGLAFKITFNLVD